MKKLITTILVGFQLVAAPLLVVAQGTTTAAPAVLYFSPAGESAATGTVTLNSAGTFNVDVKVNTHGANSSAADVHVTFSTTQLEFVSGTYPSSSTFYPNAFQGMPSAATANASGVVDMSRTIQTPAPGSAAVYTNGDGVFSNLVFRPKTGVSTANLGFNFTGIGATLDSNVAGTSMTNPDLLGAVRSVQLTIQAYTPTDTLTAVSVTPATASLAFGATQTLSTTISPTAATGVTYVWDVDGDGTLSATTGSSVTYTAGSSAGSDIVTVTATQGSVNVDDTSTITVSGTTPPTPVVDGPQIDNVVPGEGAEDTDIEVEITGSHFGSDEGRVYIGSRLADIVSWSDSQIVVLVPQVNVTHDTEYQVKVKRSDGAEDRYMGYTYLDKTGLPMLPWLIMFPLNGAAAVLAKKRWFKKK